jgi:chaperone required for assembly of F1-ATPase
MRDILGELDLGEDKMSDPVHQVQKGLQKPLPKRFYTSAGVKPGAEGGFVVTLDGKPVRTPSGRELGVPFERLAEATAAEWDAQQKHIDPAMMPLTRMINTAIDGVSTAREAVFEEILRFGGTDMLCYRAEGPETLIARESEHWDPYLDWAALQGARLVLVEGIMHVEQPAESIRALATLMRRHPSDLQLTALHTITTLTGSLVLALALAEGHAEAEEIWLAAHVDEDFNISQWGEDHEAAARKAKRLVEFEAAALILAAHAG